MIAALYVETGGIYFDQPEAIDAWDERRDARLYPGPWPVVAHPPCNRWSKMAQVHKVSRWLMGQDGGCFAAALAAVREFGGVLEHPAHSYAWDHFGLPEPSGRYWSQTLLDPGWVCEVDQGRYGHVADKPTWLYYIGAPPVALDFSGGDSLRNVRNLSKQQRKRTPVAFRDALVGLARAS